LSAEQQQLSDAVLSSIVNYKDEKSTIARLALQAANFFMELGK
jgi:hypothetical protein